MPRSERADAVSLAMEGCGNDFAGARISSSPVNRKKLAAHGYVLRKARSYRADARKIHDVGGLGERPNRAGLDNLLHDFLILRPLRLQRGNHQIGRASCRERV